MKLFLIALGGGLGSVLRYLTQIMIERYTTLSFPFGTFTINIIGCLLIGLFSGYFLNQNQPSDALKFFLITGLCGGYTTLSTFSVENMALLQENKFLPFLLYVAGSVIIGLIATYLGFKITAN